MLDPMGRSASPSRRTIGVLIGAVLLAGAVAPSASASFPGRNGEIVFGWLGESGYRAGPYASSIRAVDLRSGRVRTLLDCPLRRDRPLLGIDCFVGGPSVSPDGRTIALGSTWYAPNPTSPGAPRSNPALVTMAHDGSGVEMHPTAVSYGGWVWGPRGERLLATRTTGTPSSVFLMSREGVELREVAPTSSRMPDWSSTGEIAFSRVRKGRCFSALCFDIYLTRLGEQPRRLTYRGGEEPSWSPHGTKLAFVRSDLRRLDSDGPDLYVVRRGGGGLRRLTRRGAAANPSWSPDGRWIAFTRYGDIYVMRSTGGGLRRVLDAPSYKGSLDDPGVLSIDWRPLPRR